MIFSNRLIGIIVLGSKISGDAYSSEDLNLLNTLSKQAAIAINNAMLYKEVQDFNKTLQQKVDEQTKDIQQAYEVEKRAHNELKSIKRC
jgi:GAF domain-containing protein